MGQQNSEIELIFERIAALESFIEDFLPPLIAASAARAPLEAQLQTLADQETSTATDADLHWRAQLAENVLSRLQAG